MSAIAQQVRYEAIMSVAPKLSETGGRTGYVWVEFDEPEAELNIGTGSEISIQSNGPSSMNGVKTIIEYRRSARGYSQALIQVGNRLQDKIADYSKVTGRVYFGKVNVLAEQGGVATFVMGSDAGKVVMVVLGAFAFGMGIWFLLFGDSE